MYKCVIAFLSALMMGIALAQTYDNLEDLVEKLDADAIIDNYDKNFGTQDKKVFNNDLLVFTTPWNPLGSTWALKYAKKIQFLSPVWFDFRIRTVSKAYTDFYIEGDHNVDREYIKSLKQKNPNLQIYPRVYIEGKLYENLYHLFNSEEISVIADKFVETFRKYDQEFDGIVFDTPLISVINQLPFDFMRFIQLLNQKLGEINKNLIISLLAFQHKQLKPVYLEKLLLSSFKLLICTYDYTSSKPGEYPLAPYNWVQQYIQTFLDETSLSISVIQRKLMMGIPFYGKKIDFVAEKADSIINNQYIEILKEHKPKIQWNKEYKECYIELQNSRATVAAHIIYPCLKFIQSRLQMFEHYGVGAFVWDGGQGLQYFYELF